MAHLIEWNDYIQRKNGTVLVENNAALKTYLNEELGCISAVVREILKKGIYFGKYCYVRISPIKPYSPRYIVMDDWGKLRVMQRPVSGKKLFFCLTNEIATDVMGFTKKSGHKNFKLPNFPNPHKELETAAAIWVAKVMKYADAEKKYRPYELRALD